MSDDLKNTGKGNLFVIFGEPDIDILDAETGQIQVKINGGDVFRPHHRGSPDRRKLEAHPEIGAAQLVEIRETVKEITMPRYIEAVQALLWAIFEQVSSSMKAGGLITEADLISSLAELLTRTNQRSVRFCGC